MGQFQNVPGPSQADFDTLSEHLANIDNIDATTFTAGAKYTLESGRIQILGVYAYASLHVVANAAASSSDIIATIPSGYRPTSNATSIMMFYKNASTKEIVPWVSYSTASTNGEIKQSAITSVAANTEFFIMFAYRIASINS